MIQETFPVREWIIQLADDERRRDAVVAAARSIAAQDAAFVLAHGRRLLEALSMAVTGDVAHFQREFPDDAQRRITMQTRADGGFVVRRTAFPSVELTVTPESATAAVGCHYRFTPSSDLPAREDRFRLVLTPASGVHARFKHQGLGHVFPSVDLLSEHLLTPVFTARPRVG